MSVLVREYTENDVEDMTRIWNDVVYSGDAFPQRDPFNRDEAAAFFSEQSYTGVACLDDEVVGLYVLHPNNVGRCGHLANASYAVDADKRGHHIGEKLVRDSMRQAAQLNFKVLQFNAVVSSNTGAIHLYERLGFVRLGVVPGGFQLPSGEFEDIILYYITL